MKKKWKIWSEQFTQSENYFPSQLLKFSSSLRLAFLFTFICDSKNSRVARVGSAVFAVNCFSLFENFSAEFSCVKFLPSLLCNNNISVCFVPCSFLRLWRFECGMKSFELKIDISDPPLHENHWREKIFPIQVGKISIFRQFLSQLLIMYGAITSLQAAPFHQKLFIYVTELELTKSKWSYSWRNQISFPVLFSRSSTIHRHWRIPTTFDTIAARLSLI